MYKKVLVLLLGVLFLFSLVNADNSALKNHKVDKVTKKVGLVGPDGVNYNVKYLKNVKSPLENIGIKPTGKFNDAQPLKKKLLPKVGNTESFEDVIQYADRPYDAGFIFGPNDSVAVWFRPATQCSLLAVVVDFNDDAVGYTYNIEIHRVADHVDGVYDFSKGTESGASMDGFDQNWTGPMLGSFEYTVSAADIVEFPINAFGLTDEQQNIGLHDFAVMWAFPPETGADEAQLYGDTPTPLNHHGFKYYSEGHASLGGQPGWVARYNFSIWAKVLYYGDPPPTIENANDLADQYNSVDPGPYTVEADVKDLGTDVFTGYVRKVALILDNDDDLANGVTDTIWVYNEPSGTDDSVHVSYDIPNPGVGNSVYYWWYAEDNGAENTSDPEAVTHVTVSKKMHFTVREKNPDATILLVDDSNGQGLSEQYTSALDAYGYVYDVWDTQDGDTTSLEILSLYNTLIWYTGTANGGKFNDLVESQIIPFLDNGGNLFFSSSDFVGVREEFENEWTEWTVPTDPFITNYLKVSEILDDANATRTESGYSSDTLYTGLEGTITEPAIVDTFEADMLDFGYTDWSGEVIPADDAETIMQVFSEELGDWDQTAGLAYTGTYKLVYLPWCFESIIDGAVRTKLLSIFLGDFFGENAAPLFSNLDGPRYGVSGNGPFDVSVEVEDMDGAVATVELGYSVNQTDYVWVGMTEQDGKYVGQIPALQSGDTLVTYTVRATDDQGKTQYHTETRYIIPTDFVPENTNLLLVFDEPYDWYVGVNVDSSVIDILDEMGVAYDIWDADARGLMDAKTVLSNYHTVIWVGYADWEGDHLPMKSADNPIAEYLDMGGHFFLSSEEIMGAWTNWENAEFTSGDFAYDYLGVEWVGHDFGYDTLKTDMDPAAASLVAGLDSIVQLSVPEGSGIGNYADVIDPVGLSEDNVTAAVPFWGWLPDYEFFYYASVAYENVIFTPFTIAGLDSTVRATFLANVLNYFGTPGAPNAIEHIVETVPSKFQLKQNYPNPFNPTTKIAFDLPKASKVTLTIYNTLGQKVRTLVNNQLSAGSYLVDWDGRNEAGMKVSSGLYIYRLETDNFVATKKMMLMK